MATATLGGRKIEIIRRGRGVVTARVAGKPWLSAYDYDDVSAIGKLLKKHPLAFGIVDITIRDELPREDRR